MLFNPLRMKAADARFSAVCKATCMMLLPACLCGQKSTPSLHFFVDISNLSASGRWIPANPKDKAAYPSEVQIDCERKSKTCVEATAEYYGGHPHASLSYFQILKWDENGIIATSADAICDTRTLLVSFPDKAISATSSPKPLTEDAKGACKTFGAMDSEIDLFVVKGSQKWQDDPYGSRDK